MIASRAYFLHGEPAIFEMNSRSELKSILQEDMKKSGDSQDTSLEWIDGDVQCSPGPFKGYLDSADMDKKMNMQSSKGEPAKLKEPVRSAKKFTEKPTAKIGHASTAQEQPSSGVPQITSA